MVVVAVVLTVMILKWTVTVVINSMFSPLAIWVSSPETATKKKQKLVNAYRVSSQPGGGLPYETDGDARRLA